MRDKQTKMNEDETVCSTMEGAIGKLSSEKHRELASQLLQRISDVDPDDQLEALRRLIKEMVLTVDVETEED